MAAYDLQTWRSDMFSTLPGSTGLIVCATNVGVVSCTIKISWQENTGTANAQEATNTFQSQHYQLVVNP
jgi:hypothetical protein